MALATKAEEAKEKEPKAAPSDAEQLYMLKQKIKVGLNVEAVVDPREALPACRACYQRGWMAALKSLLED